jgi:hypothetical protein
MVKPIPQPINMSFILNSMSILFRVIERSLVGFGGLDDNPIKGLICVLIVSLQGSTQVNKCDGPKTGMFMDNGCHK